MQRPLIHSRFVKVLCLNVDIDLTQGEDMANVVPSNAQCS